MWGWNKGYSAHERQLLKMIDEQGWWCTAVEESDECPAFLYSVGFTKTLNAPEVIVFGQPFDLMYHVVGTLFDQIKDGQSLEEGQRRSGLVGGHDCEIRQVHPDNLVIEYLNSALWYWRAILGRPGDPPVFQVIWPSAKTGLFPWDAGCAEEVRFSQPPLYQPADRAAN
jgi:hypothetical protein